jgi:CheY-like chemotaxis protein
MSSITRVEALLVFSNQLFLRFSDWSALPSKSLIRPSATDRPEKRLKLNPIMKPVRFRYYMTHYPKVLVAHDDAGVREIITAIVRNTLPSARITAVENGKLALESFRRHGADLVISNFIMPEMSGPSFVKILRDSNEQVPIIMVSGSPEAEVLGKDAGIDRFVYKHDMMASLPAEIKFLLGPERVSCLNHFVTG